jgi:hypothetical protein
MSASVWRSGRSGQPYFFESEGTYEIDSPNSHKSYVHDGAEKNHILPFLFVCNKEQNADTTDTQNFFMDKGE